MKYAEGAICFTVECIVWSEVLSTI